MATLKKNEERNTVIHASVGPVSSPPACIGVVWSAIANALNDVNFVHEGTQYLCIMIVQANVCIIDMGGEIGASWICLAKRAEMAGGGFVD